MRELPIIDDQTPGAPPPEPVSFVVVRFSGDYEHNILRSENVHAPGNQLVTVDNRAGHRHDSLSAAINEGLALARHDLVAVVHEDVLLPRGWHWRLGRVLAELAASDPDWGLAGSVGWDEAGACIGHYSDPNSYRDTLRNRAFHPVQRLDEQLLVFRRSGGLRFDPDLPSIHNVGWDLAAVLAARGRRTYAVNAPTIHKFADAEGHPIETAAESPKIKARKHPANVAERACSDAYLARKWPGLAPDTAPPDEPPPGTLPDPAFGPPVILLARGGSGSRLLSTLAADLGLFLGNDVNVSGDAMDMVAPVYRAALSTHQHRAAWQRAEIVPRLRAHAARMLETGRPEGPWGFKLPEAMLILPALDAAFPGARYLHLIRDPLATCLRRTHMSGRPDNAIGRTAIRAAYLHAGLDPVQSLDEPPAMHMARTTRHQIETVRDYAAAHLAGRYRELRFEDLVADPAGQLAAAASWLGLEPWTATLAATVDPVRASSPKTVRPAADAAAALEHLRRRLGYL